jgi:hypothetical protein
VAFTSNSAPKCLTRLEPSSSLRNMYKDTISIYETLQQDYVNSLIVVQNYCHLWIISVFRLFTKLWKPTVSIVMSVRPSAWKNSSPTVRIFMKFGTWIFFENLQRKFKLHCNLTTITGTLHEDRYTFLIISRWILTRMRNVSDKSCRENQNKFYAQ